MKYSLLIILFWPSFLYSQDYGCDKCSMLREEYEAAASPEREKIYAFFKQECLETDTVFVSDQGTVASAESATLVQVVDKGKCIDYKSVQEYEKTTRKEVRKFSVNKKDTVYTFCSVLPSFPGGDEELIRFINKNINYPSGTKQKEIQGTVYLQFVVTSTGDIKNIKPIRSPGAELTNEAIRLIKSMPKWIPGKHNSKPVSVAYIIPVKFSLKAK